MNIYKQTNLKVINTFNLPILYDIFYVPNHIKKPVIIFSHGFKSFKDWGTFNLVAEFFAKKGFIFIKFNFSHNGTTVEYPDLITQERLFSENTIEKELGDLNLMISKASTSIEVNEYDINRDEIYLIGHSRGGCISILAAATNSRVKKLVTWSAFNDFPSIWKRNYDMKDWEEKGYNYRENKLTGKPLPLSYQLYTNYIENEERFNIKRAVMSISKPFMVIHGIEDEEVDYEQAIEMKKWNPAIKLNLITDCNHNLGGYHKYKKDKLPEDTLFACSETAEFFSQS